MEPEKYFIDKDIEVICVKAVSFPMGVGGAYQKLNAMLHSPEQRQLYGISYGDMNGGILYMAAAEQLHEGEAKELGLNSFTIRKGAYVSELLENWRLDERNVGITFQKLLKDPRIDNEKGYCLEIYLNKKDVRCLVKLDDTKV